MPPWLVIIFQPQTKMETSRNRILTLSTFKLNNLAIIIGLIILLSFNFTVCNGLPCQSNSWWDSANNQCIPCTECNQDQTIVLRPCQLHKDTICGSIQDLEIDYMLLAKTESNWKDIRRRKDRESTRQDFHDNLSNLKLEDEELEDWWEMFLIVLIVVFLLFFLFVAYLSFHHMSQWRQIERRLDRDVEELSAKLMAKLANVQNIENGNFIIENPIRDANARPVQVHCVLLDNYFAGKNHIGLQHPGNLYIEETNTKSST